MTVENTAVSVTYDGDGSGTYYPTTFKFLADAHLVVETSANGGTTWVTKTLGADYSVLGAGAAEPGGAVIMTVAVASGSKLRIKRRTPRTQLNSFRTTGPLPVATIEASFDKLTMIAQEDAAFIAALEAGTTGSTYTATRVTDTFTVLDPLELTFPRTVAAGVAPVTVIIGRIENLDQPGEVLDQPPSLAWSPSGTNFVVHRVNGLTPGDAYRIKYEVRS